jgi:asparagine synthase (glutamine-hydrolysing)
MSVSLEGREPFLDHRIIEFAAQLPNEFKYFKGNKKRIIKEIVHRYVPNQLMDRPKMGFAIPIESWLTNELKETVYEYLNEKNITEQGIFDKHYISKIVSDFYSGKKEYANKLWYFLMFQM